MKILKKNVLVIFLIMFFLLLIFFAKEFYIKFKYPHPELYREDYHAHFDYCRSKKFEFCNFSILCKQSLDDCEAGCIHTCRSKLFYGSKMLKKKE